MALRSPLRTITPARNSSFSRSARISNSSLGTTQSARANSLTTITMVLVKPYTLPPALPDRREPSPYISAISFMVVSATRQRQ